MSCGHRLLSSFPGDRIEGFLVDKANVYAALLLASSEGSCWARADETGPATNGEWVEVRRVPITGVGKGSYWSHPGSLDCTQTRGRKSSCLYYVADTTDRTIMTTAVAICSIVIVCLELMQWAQSPKYCCLHFIDEETKGTKDELAQGHTANEAKSRAKTTSDWL